MNTIETIFKCQSQIMKTRRTTTKIGLGLPQTHQKDRVCISGFMVCIGNLVAKYFLSKLQESREFVVLTKINT